MSRNSQSLTFLNALLAAALFLAAAHPTEAALVHQWRFDVDGTDSVGGAHMTLVSGAAIDNATFFSGGGSLAVPGTGYAATSVGIHFGNQFTIVVWSEITTVDGFQTFAATAVGGTGHPGFKLFSGRLNAQSLGWEAGGNDETAAGIVSLDTWHQIATVVDKVAGTVDYYLDGALVRSGATTNFTDDRALFTGAFADANFTGHDGWIDDLRIYDTMLTGAEIQGLIPATPIPTPTATMTTTPTATPTLPGGCPAMPAACTSAGKSVVSLRDDTDPSRRRLVWKWLKGVPLLAQGDFGDPVNGGTAYKLCVYDQSAGVPMLEMGAAVPAAGTCDTQPCWKPISTRGWKYKSRTGISDGITRIVLKGGDAGKPKVVVIGRGSGLLLPTPLSGTEFFDQDTAVIVQLHSSNPINCWSSSFDGSSTRKNDGDQFRAVTP